MIYRVTLNGKVYEVDMEHLVDGDQYVDPNHLGEYVVTQLSGPVSSTNHIEFFPYQGKLYILDGNSYQSWDGDIAHAIAAVSGYIPTILIGCSPSSGAGDTAEQINMLTKSRKVK